MDFLSLLAVVPVIDIDNGVGYCTNSTARCAFGCCGEVTNQICCFPLGVIIGCTFGLLGSLCLLVTLLRCRCGNYQGRNETASDQSNHSDRHHHDEAGGVSNHRPGTGSTNPTFCVEIRDTPQTRRVEGCPKCSYCDPPPSYEQCVTATTIASDREATHAQQRTERTPPNERRQNDTSGREGSSNGTN